MTFIRASTSTKRYLCSPNIVADDLWVGDDVGDTVVGVVGAIGDVVGEAVPGIPIMRAALSGGVIGPPVL